MRAHFDAQLQQLNIMLTEMGALIETAISRSVYALEHNDRDLAKQAVKGDDAIDNKERDIEALCLRLFMQQQPVARDLRFISAALKMITDMERIGDQASDIAEITLHTDLAFNQKKLAHLHSMAKATITMVSESVDAFVHSDLDKAMSVVDMDDIVDSLFFTIRSEIVELIKNDSSRIDEALDMFMITKYFERIGDHASNIAEWVIFALTGEHKTKEV